MKKYDFDLFEKLSKEIIKCDTINEVIELKHNNYKEFTKYFNIIENETERLNNLEFSFIVALFSTLISICVQLSYSFNVAFPIFTQESIKCTARIFLISISIGLLSTILAHPILWKKINKRNFRRYLVIRKTLNEISSHLNNITVKELLGPREYEIYFDICTSVEDAKNTICYLIKSQ